MAEMLRKKGKVSHTCIESLNTWQGALLEIHATWHWAGMTHATKDSGAALHLMQSNLKKRCCADQKGRQTSLGLTVPPTTEQMARASVSDNRRDCHKAAAAS